MLKYGRLSTGDTMVQLQIIALLRQAFIVFNSAGDDVKWLQPNAGWWGSKSHEYFTEYYCIFKGIKKSIICVELRCQPIKLCHHTTDRIGIGSIDCWGQSKKYHWFSWCLRQTWTRTESTFLKFCHFPSKSIRTLFPSYFISFFSRFTCT